MADRTSDPSAKRLEIAAAVILSPASLLTAWSSYQAAQWSRTQAIRAGGLLRWVRFDLCLLIHG